MGASQRLHYPQFTLDGGGVWRDATRPLLFLDESEDGFSPNVSFLVEPLAAPNDTLKAFANAVLEGLRATQGLQSLEVHGVTELVVHGRPSCSLVFTFSRPGPAPKAEPVPFACEQLLIDVAPWVISATLTSSAPSFEASQEQFTKLIGSLRFRRPQSQAAK